LNASKPIKEKGVDVYSLGVGSDILVKELIEIASSVDLVYSASNFDDLSEKVPQIAEEACEGRYTMCI